MTGKMYEVQKLLLSKDVPDLQKWMIVETMMEQFQDLVRAARKGDEDIIEQLAEGVPDMWDNASVEGWMAEADCYCVYPEEFPQE